MSQLPILAVAFSIYIFGIAIVLYLRPALMFKPGGSWKEFGIGRGETHTVLPFWLFAIFWAFMSYGISLVILSNFANIANAPFQQGQLQMPTQQTPVMTQQAPQPVMMQQQQAPQPNMMQQQQQQGPANFMKPVSSMIGLQQNVPGYYVLANSQNGQPQYIYYGNQPPVATKY
jgi:hypothetical protein